MLKLTNEQWQALDQENGHPLRLVHPTTNESFVLISAEQYEKLKALFEQDEMTDNEKKFLLQQAGQRAGWGEPEMDAYDDLDPRRKP